MNTSFIINKEQFLQFRTYFKNKANNKDVSASDIILYNLIRSKDATRGFSPITKLTKLNNGMDKMHGFMGGRGNLYYKMKWKEVPFRTADELFSDEVITKITEILGSYK